MDLDPRYLQAFFEVGRARSFSRAAAALHKTQPAVSYQVQQLERQLGARLFDRTTRRLTFTPAGDRLYAVCATLFGDLERLAVGLRDPAAVRTEPLRIASVSGFGRYVLFPALARLPALQRYSLRFPTAEEVFASLDAGTCDVGFVHLPRVSSRLHTAEAVREELVLIAPRGRAPRRVPPTADALAELPAVTYDESDYVFGTWFERVFGRQPRSVHADYHFEELEEVVATVAAGRGWSIVPEPCARHARGVVIHRAARRRVDNPIYVVTRPGADAHPALPKLLAGLTAGGTPRPRGPRTAARRRGAT
jgi:LysR family transcriptional regulator, cyn operon transcriptional activator